MYGPAKKLSRVNANLQQAIAAAAAHLRDARHPHRGAERPGAAAAARRSATGIEFRDVTLRLRRRRPAAILRGVSFTRARGPDGGHRRPQRRRQDDAGQPDPAVLRRDRRRDPRRRRRHPRRHARVAAGADRDGDAGDGAVRRHDRGATSPTAAAARRRAQIEAAARAAHAHEFISALPERYDDADRRARPAAVRRAAAAPRDRAGAAEELAAPDPRRGDLVARRRVGAAGAGRAGEPDARTARRSSSRTGCRRSAGPTRSSCSSGAASWRSGRTTSCSRGRTACTRSCTQCSCSRAARERGVEGVPRWRAGAGRAA